LEESRSLRLRLTVPDQTLSPGEFLSLFDCAETVSRALIEHEALALLEFLDFPADSRLQTMQTIHRLGRRVPTPAEVVSVEHACWTANVLIGGPVVLFILMNYVHPTVKDAFDDSRLKQLIVEFLRDRVFLGAKRTVEQAAVARPTYGNLGVRAVAELRAAPSEPELEVTLERREIIAVRSSDRELVEEFAERIGSTRH